MVSQVHDQGATLTNLLWTDCDLQPFLNRLTETQRETLQDSTRYIGASIRLTYKTCEEWEKKISKIRVPTVKNNNE